MKKYWCDVYSLNMQITFFIGLLFNEALNAVLKHIIKQPRPMSRDNMYNEYGMPSSHSQFMWFFSIYMFLFIWVRLQHITNTKTVWFCKTIGSFGCFVTALVVTFSRCVSQTILFLTVYQSGLYISEYICCTTQLTRWLLAPLLVPFWACFGFYWPIMFSPRGSKQWLPGKL